MRTGRRVAMALLLALLCGCRIAPGASPGEPISPENNTPSALPSPLPSTADPTPSVEPSTAPDSADEKLEQRLAKVPGVRDPVAVAAEDDLDCLLGESDKSAVVDIRFTAQTPTAMNKALRVGRDALKDLELSDICVIGTFSDTGDIIQINATDDYVGSDWPSDETWPSAAMIKKVVDTAHGHRPDVGKTHLYWTASAEGAVESQLQLGTNLDDKTLTDARAITTFQTIEKSWRPPNDYDRLSIFVTSASGSLDATQWGAAQPWKAVVPATLIDVYRRTAADFGSASVARRFRENGSSTEQFDFLYPIDDEAKIGWAARQRKAHEVIKAYFATPADERADSLGIRTGKGKALDFNTSGCEGILPGQNNRQTKDQTRTLYRWYAANYPAQAKKDGVDHC